MVPAPPSCCTDPSATSGSASRGPCCATTDLSPPHRQPRRRFDSIIETPHGAGGHQKWLWRGFRDWAYCSSVPWRRVACSPGRSDLVPARPRAHRARAAGRGRRPPRARASVRQRRPARSCSTALISAATPTEWFRWTSFAPPSTAPRSGAMMRMRISPKVRAVFTFAGYATWHRPNPAADQHADTRIHGRSQVSAIPLDGCQRSSPGAAAVLGRCAAGHPGR